MTPLQGYDAEPNPRSYSPLQQSDVMDGGVFVPPESVSLGRRLWNRSDRQVIVKSSLSVAVDRHWDRRDFDLFIDLVFSNKENQEILDYRSILHRYFNPLVFWY